MRRFSRMRPRSAAPRREAAGWRPAWVSGAGRVGRPGEDEGGGVGLRPRPPYSPLLLAPHVPTPYPLLPSPACRAYSSSSSVVGYAPRRASARTCSGYHRLLGVGLRVGRAMARATARARAMARARVSEWPLRAPRRHGTRGPRWRRRGARVAVARAAADVGRAPAAAREEQRGLGAEGGLVVGGVVVRAASRLPPWTAPCIARSSYRAARAMGTHAPAARAAERRASAWVAVACLAAVGSPRPPA